MDRTALRRSLIGAAVGGGIFGAVSVYRSLVAGGPLLDYAGPVGILVVIGATVGGLVGPLLGQAWSRRGQRKKTGEREATGGRLRPPLWVTLLVGGGVGLGAGIAWGLPWVGVAFGLVLAAGARAIFR